MSAKDKKTLLQPIKSAKDNQFQPYNKTPIILKKQFSKQYNQLLKNNPCSLDRNKNVENYYGDVHIKYKQREKSFCNTANRKKRDLNDVEKWNHKRANKIRNDCLEYLQVVRMQMNKQTNQRYSEKEDFLTNQEKLILEYNLVYDYKSQLLSPFLFDQKETKNNNKK